MVLQKNVNGTRLRCGYTTGSCAAAAAKAAAAMLLEERIISSICLPTPKGIVLTLDVLDAVIEKGQASCAIQKDSGDDPDVTNGMLVYAQVRKIETGIEIDGGTGVGRVTRPGLDQPVGAAAINSTPRKMIAEAVSEICMQCGYKGGIRVVVSIPEGEELAKRTFNPRMGIEGGLSVIGTTGIVEPMSHQALIESIRLEIRQRAAAGSKSILLTPGNYGETFAREALNFELHRHVNCSNFIGDAIDACVEEGFQEILLVGHIGKLVKLGIGLMNTHSAFGDGRMETLLSCALVVGADTTLLRDVASCVTTDGALVLLKNAGLLEKTMENLGTRISGTLARRVPDDVTIGFVCFTKADGLSGILCQSGNAQTLMNAWRDTI